MNKMIKTISLMLTLTLTLTAQLGSSVIATSSIDQVKDKDHMQLYRECLLKYSAEIEAIGLDHDDPEYISEYALIDINDDGIDELFVWYPEEMVNGSFNDAYDCYTIKDGELSLILTNGYSRMGGTTLTKDFYIIRRYIYMNDHTETVYRLSPTGEVELLIEHNIFQDILNNSGEQIYHFDYYDNGELVDSKSSKTYDTQEMAEFNSYIGEPYEFTTIPISSMLNNEIIEWHDDIIEASVRHQLNKPTGDISASDVLNITELLDIKKPYVDGKYGKVQNIEDLKYLINLKSLSLVHNEISDISPLENLNQLELLFLNNNQISDISALTGLSNLKALFLYDNQISDISSLSMLRNLQRLLLNNNDISDISSLNNLNNLNYLDLSNNNITDISSIPQLQNIYELNLSNNNISDISSQPQLQNISQLNLSNNNISDISVLPQLQNISQLDLSNNNITDISVLIGTKDLMSLDIRNNNITDFTPVSLWSDYKLKK